MPPNPYQSPQEREASNPPPPARTPSNWGKWACLSGVLSMLIGVGGVLLFAEAAVSAVFPHGTGPTKQSGLFVVSLCILGAGAVTVVVGGLGWLVTSIRRTRK